MWQRIFLGISLLLNIFLVLRMCLGDQGLAGYKELDRQHSELEAKLQELDEKNILLTQEIRLLDKDERYVERIIRGRLHYIRDNEVLYLFPESAFPTNRGAGSDEREN